MNLNVVRYNPLKASSYIDLPESIKNKQACVNVQNNDDEKCFVWAILSAEKNIKNNPQRLEHYTPFENTINMDGIPTPVPITSIPRFERLNNRSVNVYVLRWNNTLKKYDVDPIYFPDKTATPRQSTTFIKQARKVTLRLDKRLEPTRTRTIFATSCKTFHLRPLSSRIQLTEDVGKT